MPNPPVLTVTAKYFTSLILLVFITACGASKKTSAIQLIEDPHSFSKPEISGVKHLELELKVDFDAQRIHGIARYDLHQGHGSELILDHLGLRIQEVFIESPGGLKVVKYSLDDPRPYLGSALRIPLEKETRRVHIHYSSGTDAVALQWVPRAQTHDKSGEFLFTQSQSVYARSWIPCPDGPGMRFTYRATVQVPKGMNAVMSARRVKQEPLEGLYQFEMEIPIPAYLLALAVGDFKFKAIGNRTGVYAESSILEQAAYEFEDLEKMLLAAEQLYGPYPWGRYDVLVLPPSFPFGGMENPRMTFVTPSVISGDRSLTSLLAHELAHSWSGNLVTNASWNDFWLNEGFTTYFESRIMEALYGKAYADMLSLLGIVLLRQTMEDLGWDSPLTRLKLDLKEMDPEEAMTDI
ncbi:MAG TPA: M1 family aminopeptidase/hydrolase, partial [Saprospiraceae bacterium]|nr:M1 family aminopeptidase/hydrolase [Saprospiraceae bacterium]